MILYEMRSFIVVIDQLHRIDDDITRNLDLALGDWNTTSEYVVHGVRKQRYHLDDSQWTPYCGLDVIGSCNALGSRDLFDLFIILT